MATSRSDRLKAFFNTPASEEGSAALASEEDSAASTSRKERLKSFFNSPAETKKPTMQDLYEAVPEYLPTGEKDTRSRNPEDYGVWDKVVNTAKALPKALEDVINTPAALANIYAGASDDPNARAGVRTLFNLTTDTIPKLFRGELSLDTPQDRNAVISGFMNNEIPPTTEAVGLQPAFDALTQRRIPKGVSGVADAAHTAALWAAGGVPRIGQNVVKGLAKSESLRDALRGTSIDAAMGVGAAAGEALLGGAGEVGGGLLGLVFGVGKGASKANLSAQAVSFIKENADNSTLALANIRRNIKEGKKGTLDMLAEDIGISNVYKTFNEKGRTEATKAVKKRAEGLAQSADRMREIGGGDNPLDVDAFIDRSIQSAQDQAEHAEGLVKATAASQAASAQLAHNKQVADLTQADDLARANAEQVNKPLVNAPLVSDAGINLSARVEDIKRTLNDNASAHWSAFDKEKVIKDIGVAKTEIAQVKQRLSPAAKADLERTESIVLGHIKNLSSASAPKDVQWIVKDMKQAIHNAHKNNTATALDGILNKIVGKLEDSLQKTPHYIEARAATKDMHRRTGGLEKALNKVPEKAAENIYEGAKGAELMRHTQQLDDPAAMEALIDGFRANAAASGKPIDNAFMVANREFLAKNPKLKKEFEGYLAANVAADASTAALTRGTQVAKDALKAEQAVIESMLADASKTKTGALKAASDTPFGRYAKAANKQTHINKLITNAADGNKELGQLYARLKKEGAEGALEQRVLNAVTDSVFNPQGGVTGSTLAKYDKIKTGLNNSGFAGSPKMKQLDDQMTKLREQHFRDSYSGSLVKLGTELTSKDRLAASALAAVLTGGLGGGRSLIIAGAVRRAILGNMKEGRFNQRHIKAISEYIADPESFMGAVDGAASNEQIVSAIVSRINALGQTINGQE